MKVDRLGGVNTSKVAIIRSYHLFPGFEEDSDKTVFILILGGYLKPFWE